ncbi:Uncharacterized protein dnm_092570 [Desulfonema magnum]|uniref:Uncharacterized protein n=1 Tax=Desulfonema magnum TaxID=45655 RepID=A0A975BXU7_9BACT|nr:Uncharacterized protein dnm_092570 [Desulfonema magnum]
MIITDSYVTYHNHKISSNFFSKTSAKAASLSLIFPFLQCLFTFIFSDYNGFREGSPSPVEAACL